MRRWRRRLPDVAIFRPVETTPTLLTPVQFFRTKQSCSILKLMLDMIKVGRTIIT